MAGEDTYPPTTTNRAAARDGTGAGAPAPAARLWRTGWLPLVAIMVLMAGLRFYHITVPFIDTSDWRQTDTAAIAYFYYHLGIAFLHPQLWHDGPGPDYTQLELQLTPAIAALLAHVFGYSDELLRIVAVAVDTASVVPLWALARRRFGPRTAFWTALIYALLPLGIYFGRAFQPEPMMLLTGNLALWAADRAGERRSVARDLLTALLLSLAVLAKLPNLMLIPPALALACGPGRWLGPAFRQPGQGPFWARLWRAWRTLARLCVLALIPIAAGAAYTFGEGHIVAEAGGSSYVAFILRSLPSSYVAGTTSIERFLWRNVLGMAITPAGLAAMVLGFWRLLPRARRGNHTWLIVWALALLAYAGVVLRAIRLQYYLVPTLPFIALLCGIGLAALVGAAPRRRAGTAPRLAAASPAEAPPRPADTASPRPVIWPYLRAAAAVLVVVSMLAGGLSEISSYWPPYWPWYQLGVALNRTLPAKATLLLGGTYNPTIFYYARRHGWRVSPITVQAVQDSPADYLVPAVDPGACMDAYLETHFASFTVAGTRIYDLKERLVTEIQIASPYVSTANNCAATGSP